MDDWSVAHGLLYQFKSLRWHWADLPSFFFPAPPIDPSHLHNLHHCQNDYQISKNLSIG